MANTWCIKCRKTITWDDEYCPYCGQRQFMEYKKTLPRAKKVNVKSKPVYSGAEVYTAIQKREDTGYLAFLATKLFGG